MANFLVPSFFVTSKFPRRIKVAIGKLPLPEPLDSYISSRMVRLGARYLEITASHALLTATLALHHLLYLSKC
ncbi:hypothetical protein [Trichormus azollae]|uniref:hypothetical protein n=1 Tax=Trichormus azollae TaxID=1164 RepID=UPI00325FB06A